MKELKLLNKGLVKVVSFVGQVLARIKEIFVFASQDSEKTINL